MANDTAEVQMLIQEIAAIREAMNLNLDAILARLERMQPERKTDPRVPSGWKNRQKFYKGYLSQP